MVRAVGNVQAAVVHHDAVERGYGFAAIFLRQPRSHVPFVFGRAVHGAFCVVQDQFFNFRLPENAAPRHADAHFADGQVGFTLRCLQARIADGNGGAGEQRALDVFVERDAVSRFLHGAVGALRQHVVVGKTVQRGIRAQVSQYQGEYAVSQFCRP